MDEKIEILLKARARWQSDDQRRAAKLMMRINGVDTDFQLVKKHVDSTLTPLVLCLQELCNMQLIAEEVDSVDRQQIALYGALTQNQTPSVNEE
jgi:hypothetical protein